ncbi:HU family DNA-binding protein [Siccirubricoccus phaeus]|uniref:HU family DNA-binding protein n=1 Tax=Siccirubricoccus phaeus TaxID=2595053 RepID=UPI0011F163D2|nr:HU family DNA-binding protein [Siccirubricoccus phaeus]
MLPADWPDESAPAMQFVRLPEKAVDIVLDAMTHALRNRAEVRLRRFGVFRVVTKRGGKVAQGGASGRSERVTHVAPERPSVRLRISRVLAEILRRGADTP